MLLVAAVQRARGAAGGGVRAALTLDNYRRALDPLYLVRARALRVARAAHDRRLARARVPDRLGDPRGSGAAPGILLALVIIPSWMNLLIKNYAWIVILRREGVLNTALTSLGLIDQPLALLFAPSAVLVGLVHTYLPFMVLPLYVALDRMDWSLVEAARDLGAGRAAVFRQVVVPQTLAGVAVGCTLVFIPTLGAFVTPDLLGGPDSLMVGTLIENQLLQVRNWPFASALAVLLMAVVAVALAAVRRLQGADAPELIA
jgi:ABC-type spermidine/putrescine transport system permease subunit I